MNNHCCSTAPSSEKCSAIFSTVNKLITSQFCTHAPLPTMRAKINLAEDENAERICRKVIEKAHEERNGKLTVKRKGVVIDNNGHRIEAFAFATGLYEVEQTLYKGIMVIMRSQECHLLLIRSDVTTPLNTLFPDIGTAQDWKVLQNCVDRFSPKASSHRYVIDIRSSQYAAAEAAAENCLVQSGAFQQHDLDILRDMAPAKLHMLDLCSTIVLTPAFTEDLAPRMVNVVCTRSAADLEEVQRVLRAWSFSPQEQMSGLYVPYKTVTSKKGVDEWQRSTRFAYIRYNKPQDVDCIFAAMSRAATSDSAFSKVFPYPPVVVGPSIWSDQLCVEIDMRGLRFSDEELLTGQKYIASLLKGHNRLMLAFAESWKQSVTANNAAVTSYPQLWFQAFHFAAATTLFAAGPALLDYLNLTRESDARRLRLRTDRAQRYANAIQKLKEATTDTPWLYLSKPETKDKALSLLKKNYDAFLHRKDGEPVLAFTDTSLVRCANLENGELEDFISKLKENHLLSNKTHPVSFAGKEQHRFICLKAEALTVTANNREEVS